MPTSLPSAAWPLPLALALAAAARGQEPAEPPLQPVAQHPRVHTDRGSTRLLKLPKEEDAFGFVVFGDRTGGPAEGIEVLARAVEDTNLLDPDLVMTVGDLVQGYNQRPDWERQAAEFKGVMDRLRMPWFPVAGNHDVYWRGPDKPPEEHERDYERHFAPLWYAFEHKRCWFVVLYTDEPDPATGARNFNDPACHRFSDAQFGWLERTLLQAREARHVFVFLHHPRWIGSRYEGADWERVHAALARHGNVRAVFAGHIHRMRFDGERDGIQYYALATTGGTLEFELPGAGYLHQFHVVTVRPTGIQVATLPVGTVVDPKTITGQVSENADLLVTELRPRNARGIAFARGGAVLGTLRVDFHNPAHRPIELTVHARGDDAWSFAPDHAHATVAAGASATVEFHARRRTDLGLPVTLPRLSIDCDYLGEGLRFSLPAKEVDVELPPPQDLAAGPAPPEDGVLLLEGRGSCLRIGHEQLRVPDGPLTVEAWLCATRLGGRRGLVTKTESSEYGLFVSDGVLTFSVFVGGAYANAESGTPVLEAGRWHHVAGVFDGREVRAYVDGRLLAAAPAGGPRRTNELPLYIGADPDRSGAPMSLFEGRIDEVRVSTVARYAGDSFAPERRHAPDGDTALLLHLDSDAGAWTPDHSPQRAHARRCGAAACVPAGSGDGAR